MNLKMSGKTLFTLATILWLVPTSLWSNGYSDEFLPVPSGVIDGWTAFPDKNSSLGDGFFVAPSPGLSEDSVTGVWALQENSLGEYELRNIASFRELIRACPAAVSHSIVGVKRG